MASPPLTIRNLTATQVELKLLERFEDVAAKRRGFSITTTFGWSNRTGPTSLQLASKAESFTKQDVSIPIPPFETKITAIQPTPIETLRLTFEVEGQRYRIGTPIPTKRSATFTSLSPDPRFEFTAVYAPKSSHLAIFPTAKLESWMSKLRDETPLSALSIPGTHNSPTHHTALPSVRCQAVSVKEQLDNGVRFLDIRVQPETSDDTSKDGLVLVHSAFPVSLTGSRYFRDLVNVVHSFLEANPTETVIISLKREGIGKATDQHLSKIVHQHYANDGNLWFVDNRIPSLGEARGKIVLIRRFAIDDPLKGLNDGKGFAIDAESWPDNCADGICSSGEIRVQDFYEVGEHENIHKKIGFSTDQLARSAQVVCPLPDDTDAAVEAAEQQPFFMNFLSASNFWRTNCWPDRIAAKINPLIVEHVCQKHNHPGEGRTVGDGSTGIVVCDWVGVDGDWDLVRCIVGMNAKIEMR